MSVNGITSSISTGIQIVHNTTDQGTDKRRWVAQDVAGNVYKAWIADNLKVAWQINNDAIQYSNDALPANTTGDMSICIDRDVKTIYVIANNGWTITLLSSVDITSRNVTFLADMSVGHVLPLKAIINTQGDKIVWLGSNNTLYSMDLDGGKLRYVFTTSYNVTSFALSKDNVAYVFYRGDEHSDMYLHSVDIATMEDNKMLFSLTPLCDHAVNCFIYNNNFYAVVDAAVFGVDYSALIVVSFTGELLTSIDLNSLYAIDGRDIKKFNLGYDSYLGKYYGYLAVNNGTDQQNLYQVDLDTLALTPLRKTSLVKDTDPITEVVTTTFKGEFSNDTSKPIQRIVMGGSNDDWTGCEWETVTGGI